MAKKNTTATTPPPVELAPAMDVDALGEQFSQLMGSGMMQDIMSKFAAVAPGAAAASPVAVASAKYDALDRVDLMRAAQQVQDAFKESPSSVGYDFAAAAAATTPPLPAHVADAMRGVLGDGSFYALPHPTGGVILMSSAVGVVGVLTADALDAWARESTRALRHSLITRGRATPPPPPTRTAPAAAPAPAPAHTDAL